MNTFFLQYIGTSFHHTLIVVALKNKYFAIHECEIDKLKSHTVKKYMFMICNHIFSFVKST